MMPVEFAAMVTIDWADQKHAWSLQAGTAKVEAAPSTTRQRPLTYGPPTFGCGSADRRSTWLSSNRQDRSCSCLTKVRTPRDLSRSPDDPRELPQELSRFWSEG